MKKIIKFPSNALYIILGIMLCLMIGLMYWGFYAPFVFLLFISVCLFLIKSTIILYDDKIQYITLFKTTVIEFKNVTKVSVKVGLRTSFLLQIYTNKNVLQPELEINWASLGATNAKSFMADISLNPNVIIDEGAKTLIDSGRLAFMQTNSYKQQTGI